MSQERSGQPGPSTGAVNCKWINLLLAAFALLGFLLSIDSLDERAPAGILLGVPGILLQILAGLLPALHYVRRDELVGAPRRWLLWPSIIGLTLWGASVLISVMFFQGPF